MFYIIVVYMLFISLCFGGVTKSTFKPVEANLFGRKYYYNVLETEFDEDLYYLDQCGCPCNNGSSCPANYIGPINETGINITQLNYNEWAYVNTTNKVYFKFNIEPNANKPCPVLSIKIEALMGYPFLGISLGELPNGLANDWNMLAYSRGSTCICGPLFSFGTYYLVVIPQNNNPTSAGRIKYELSEPLDCIPPSVPPYPSDDTFKWLDDGHPSYDSITPDYSLFYRYHVNQTCTNMTISLYSLTQYGDIDLFLSYENPEPTYGAYDLMSPTVGDDTIALVLCNPKNTPDWTFYIGATTYLGDADIMIVATERIYNPRKVSDVAFAQFFYTFSLGFFNMKCSNFSLVCDFPQYPNCQTDSGNFLSCCHALYPIAPTEAPNPFFPWPLGDASMAWMNYIPWQNNLPNIERKLSWALYLGYSTPDGNHFKFNSFPDLSQCEINIKGYMINSNGMPFNEPIKFTPKENKCDLSSLSSKIDQYQRNVDEMRTSSSFEQLSSLHVKNVILNYDDDVVGCKNEVEKYISYSKSYENSYQYQNCRSDFEGTDLFYGDPCCFNYFYLDNCCPLRTATSTPLLAQVNQPIIESSSSNSKNCLSKKIFDLALQYNSQSDCNSKFYETSDFRVRDNLKSFLSGCIADIIGEAGKGITCQSDSDCLTTCNPITHLCDHNESLILKCYAEKIDERLLRLLYIKWKIDEPSNDRDIFYEHLSSMLIQPGCIGPDAIQFRDHYQFKSVTVCPDGCVEPICYSPGPCTIPVRCQNGVSPCWRAWKLVAATSSCTDPVCNWMDCKGLSPTDCQAACLNNLSNETCVNCNGGKCAEVVGYNQTMCNEGLCSIPNIYTAEECLSSGSCSNECINCTKEECEANGICSDTPQLLKAMAKFNSSGVCILKLRNYFDTIYCYPPAIAFPYGCADNRDPATCAQLGGVYRTPAKNREECESFSLKNSTIGIFDEQISYFLRVPLDEAETCLLDPKDKIPYVNWKQGKWVSGSIKPLSWISRNYTSIRKIGPTVNFRKFASEVEDTISELFSYSFTTEALCRYDRAYKIISDILCENDYCASSDLFSVYLEALGLACPYLDTEHTTHSGFIKISNNTIPHNLGCKKVSLYFASANAFQSVQSNYLSSQIFLKRQPNTYSVVLNNYGVPIGQTITNGLGFNFPENIELEDDIYICLDFIDSIPIDDEYVNFGIAQLLPNNTILFKSLSSTVTNTSVCGYVSSVGIYFGVKVISHYTRDNEYELSTIVQAYIAAVLYLFLALFVLVQSFRVVKIVKTENLKFKLSVLIIIIIFALLRSIYFFIFVRGYSTAAFSVIFFELPTLLFFIQYLSILYLWFNLLVKINLFGEETAHARILYLAFNILIILIFLIFIGIFYSLPSESSEPCTFSLILTTSTQRSLTNQVYAFIIAVLCILIALNYLYLGIRIVRTIAKAHSGMGTRQNSIDQTIIRLTLFVMITFSSMFIIRSLLILVAVTLNRSFPLLLLAVLEIFPSFVLMNYVAPLFSLVKKRTRSTSSNNNKSGPNLQVSNSTNSQTSHSNNKAETATN